MIKFVFLGAAILFVLAVPLTAAISTLLNWQGFVMLLPMVSVHALGRNLPVINCSGRRCSACPQPSYAAS